MNDTPYAKKFIELKSSIASTPSYRNDVINELNALFLSPVTKIEFNQVSPSYLSRESTGNSMERNSSGRLSEGVLDDVLLDLMNDFEVNECQDMDVVTNEIQTFSADTKPIRKNVAASQQLQSNFVDAKSSKISTPATSKRVNVQRAQIRAEPSYILKGSPSESTISVVNKPLRQVPVDGPRVKPGATPMTKAIQRRNQLLCNVVEEGTQTLLSPQKFDNNVCVGIRTDTSSTTDNNQRVNRVAGRDYSVLPLAWQTSVYIMSVYVVLIML